ncbi:unnamed protein product [Merluccius merluccius]
MRTAPLWRLMDAMQTLDWRLTQHGLRQHGGQDLHRRLQGPSTRTHGVMMAPNGWTPSADLSPPPPPLQRESNHREGPPPPPRLPNGRATTVKVHLLSQESLQRPLGTSGETILIHGGAKTNSAPLLLIAERRARLEGGG